MNVARTKCRFMILELIVPFLITLHFLLFAFLIQLECRKSQN